jgi:hypothetical protein
VVLNQDVRLGKNELLDLQQVGKIDVAIDVHITMRIL